jgi:Tfp pilus assembly protein PilX
MESRKISQQSGSVLAISLVLLTAITIIAIMGIQRSGLQTKIVGNLQHKEGVFQASLSEQEFWFNTLRDTDNRQLLLQLINSETVDGNGNTVPLSVSLPVSSRAQAIANQLQVSTSAILTSKEGVLVEGFELGTHMNYRFQLDTDATYQRRRGVTSPQRTGFSLPGLVMSSNTL